jgi:hypothetical protein
MMCCDSLLGVIVTSSYLNQSPLSKIIAPYQNDGLKMNGNAVIPAVAAEANLDFCGNDM